MGYPPARRRPKSRSQLRALPIDRTTTRQHRIKHIRRGRLIPRRPRKLAVYWTSRSPRKALNKTPQAGPSNPNANCVQARANQRRPVELSLLLQPCHGAKSPVAIALFAAALATEIFRQISFLRSSRRADIDNGLGESLRRLLRQIVADAARDGPVLVLAREFLRVSARLRAGRAVGVAFKSDGRPRDDGRLRQPLFQIVIF